MIDRRTLLAGIASAALTSSAHAHSGARPSIGAIRWDAWYTQSSTDGIRSVVQKTLGPARWHGRAPSCAVVEAPDAISFDKCGIQSRIDSEIQKAHQAGIDYWAYCGFGSDRPSMLQAWRLHQNSAKKDWVNWCCIFNYAQFVRQVYSALPDLVNYLKMPNHHTVLSGRPLLYIMSDNTAFSVLAEGIRVFRLECQRTGLKNPYVALMLSSPVRGILATTGADAVSAYEKAGPTPIAGDYAELVTIAENYWKTLADTGQAIVPTAMTGWDTRPRQETPSWPTNPRGPNGEEHYFVPGTPRQIAAHVRDMLDWIRLNPQFCPAQTGIIYSWDEHDEGGSVLNFTIEGGESILNAVGQALR